MPIGLGIGISVGASAQARGGGVAPFSPADISGLQLWLDATTGLFDATSGGSPVTADGSAVARWEDQSENTRHATQSVLSNRAILKTSIQNLRNSVRFDGTNDFYTGLSQALLVANSTNKFSIFIASIPDLTGRQGSYGGGGILRKMPVSESSSSYYIGYRSSGALAFSCIGNPNSISSNTIVSDDTPVLGFIEYDGTAGATKANQTKLFINEVESAKTSDNGAAGWGVGDGELGRGYTSSDYHFKGDLLEIIVYHKILTVSDRQKVEIYLNTKWAIY